MAFATTADLGRYLGRTLTEDEEFRAALLLQTASGAIRGYLRQTVSRVTSSAVLRGNWTSVLTLPERPVSSVTSVTIAATALTVDSGYTWDGGDRLYRGARLLGTSQPYDPDPMRHELHWGGPSAKVTVVYVHGWADGSIPDDVKGVNLEMVARSMHTTPGVKQESIGQYSYTADAPGTSSAASLTTEMRRQLKWLRR